MLCIQNGAANSVPCLELHTALTTPDPCTEIIDAMHEKCGALLMPS